MVKILLISCGVILLHSNDSHYVAQKYSNLLDHKIDNYIDLIVKVEKCKLCRPTFNHVRFLFFTHPCIIRCYTELIKKESVAPLYHLWMAYKAETVSCDKNKFLYEFCHLIGIVFEQFMIKLLTEVSDESGESLVEVFNKISADMPIDELIEVLETCYKKLMEVVQKLGTQKYVTIQKRWVVMIVACLFVVKKLYTAFYGQRSPEPEIAVQQG